MFLIQATCFEILRLQRHFHSNRKWGKNAKSRKKFSFAETRRWKQILIATRESQATFKRGIHGRSLETCFCFVIVCSSHDSSFLSRRNVLPRSFRRSTVVNLAVRYFLRHVSTVVYSKLSYPIDFSCENTRLMFLRYFLKLSVIYVSSDSLKRT